MLQDLKARLASFQEQLNNTEDEQVYYYHYTTHYIILSYSIISGFAEL